MQNLITRVINMMPNQSPFQQAKPMGPSISPATMHSAGKGGQQNPTYLQTRKPVAPTGMATSPVITPKPSMMGDTVNPKPTQQAGMPPITPMGTNPTASGTPGQAGGNSLGDVYNFFKSDLQNQTKQAKSNAVADASARGVYYGTPLTGSEADIDTQYLRGLGQLQSGMYGNEQSNQLARLGMATNLSAQNAMNAPAPSQPMDWSGLGALFGSSNNPSSQSNVASNSANPQGPNITPRQGPVNRTAGIGTNPVDPNKSQY